MLPVASLLMYLYNCLLFEKAVGIGIVNEFYNPLVYAS